MGLETMMEKCVRYADMGKIRYEDALKLQIQLVEDRKKDDIPDTILLCEHNPCIYFGSREKHNRFSIGLVEEVKKEKGVLDEKTIIEYLKDKGVEFYRSNGGGGASYLGPGQLTFYPIVDISKITGKVIGVGDYGKIIDRIMRASLVEWGVKAEIFDVVKKFGEPVDCERGDRRDVWVIKDGKNYKIGGKGVRVVKGKDNYIAYHGFNFYFTSESVDGFRYIDACGYTKDELGVTSVEEELGRKLNISYFKNNVLRFIRMYFGYTEMMEVDKDSLFT